MNNKTLTEKAKEVIITHLREYDVLSELWPELAVFVSGSFGARMADKHSDVDVYVLYPESHHQAIAGCFLREDRVDDIEYLVLNLPVSPSGHFSLQTFESARRKVAQAECISMYRYAHSITLHDPTGEFSAIREGAHRLPEGAITRLLESECGLLAYHASPESTGSLLRRGDRATLCLRTWKGLEQALRICCVLDRLPYPHGKRILQVGLQTTLGRELKDLFEDFFNLLETDALQQTPVPTEKPALPKHEGLQYYRHYCLQRRLWSILVDRLQKASVSRRRLSRLSELAEL